jgi:hypothetical protein
MRAVPSMTVSSTEVPRVFRTRNDQQHGEERGGVVLFCGGA